MMKRVIFLVCFIAIGVVAYAGNDKPVQPNELPEKAQRLIKQHFPNAEISYAKREDELFDKSYEVVLVDGSKIEFHNNGDWKEIDCRYGKVPEAIIPKAIRDYVRRTYKSQIIVSIDRDRRDYEIALSNGIELKFDLKGNFIRPD